MERIVKIDKYYTCLSQMEKRFEKNGRKQAMRAETREEYHEWKNGVRKLLWKTLGMDKMETCSLSPVLIERMEAEPGIIREKVLLQVEPEVWMPVFILIPEKNNRKCILAPPGHCGAGKYSVAGVKEIPAVADKINFYHYDYGMQLARLGYVVLCNDSRGFGERREAALQKDDENSFINSTCFQLGNMALGLGMTVAGMCTWDLMRLLDYISERKEWEADSVGCVGFSGGGMQTLWLAAFDERIRYAVISGYMYGCRDALLKLNGNCSCNYIPGLWELVDMGDIGSLLAPRPVMIQSCTEDKLNGERGVVNAIEQVAIMREAYKLFDAENRILHDMPGGGHRFHGDRIEEFLKEYVRASI